MKLVLSFNKTGLKKLKNKLRNSIKEEKSNFGSVGSVGSIGKILFFDR